MPSKKSKIAKKLIMQKFTLSRVVFDFEEQSSEDSAESVLYISSDEKEEATNSCDSDWSTDTEALINRIEREVKSSPILIAGRVMATEGLDDEMEAGRCSSRPVSPTTPKLGVKYFDKNSATRLPGKRKMQKSSSVTQFYQLWNRPCHSPNPRTGKGAFTGRSNAAIER